MERRRFLWLGLGAGVGLGLGAGLTLSALRWSAPRGFPGMPIRLHGLRPEEIPPNCRLHVTASRGGIVERVVLDCPVAEAPRELEVPVLRRRPADTEYHIHARVVDPSGRALDHTRAPLVVRFRAFRFGV